MDELVSGIQVGLEPARCGSELHQYHDMGQLIAQVDAHKVNPHHHLPATPKPEIHHIKVHDNIHYT